MTKITKMFVVIASSLLMSVAAVAGELSVTGSAKASYLVNGGGSNNNDKGIGISNELKFSASGELDNGYSWNYHMELDPNGGGTTDNDDSSLTINTNGMGTIGFFDSEGGLSTELGYGVGALGTGVDYANTMASSGHTSMNSAGATGDSLTQVQLTAAPIDGLKVGADYASAENETGTVDQELTGGNWYAQYALGNIKVGYMQGYKEAGKATYADGDGSSYDSYEYNAMGIEFALNDAVTVSFDQTQNEAKDKGQIADTKTTRTTQTVEMEADTMQIAYNIGGATVGLFHVDTTNSQFTTGRDETKTIASIAMEF